MMPKNFVTTVLSAAALASAMPLLSAQSTATPRAQGQEPPATTEAPAIQSASVDDLIDQLGSAKFRERKAATRELERRGAAVRSDLRIAAQDHDDAEVRMRAQRIVSRLDERSNGPTVKDVLEGNSGRTGLRLRTPGRRSLDQPGQPEGSRLRIELDAVREQIEELLERRNGADDILKQVRDQLDQIEGLRGHIGLPLIESFGQFPEGFTIPHVEVGELDLPPGFHRFQQGFPKLESIRFPQFGAGQGGKFGQSFSMSMGPNGVRVEVEVDEDGETEKKVYEAESLEDFRKQYPDIAKQYFGDGDSQPQFGWFNRQGGDPDAAPLNPYFRWRDGNNLWPVQPGQDVEVLEAAEDEPAAGQRLGVYVDAVDPAVAQFLGFGAGQGLEIRSVSKDSLAADLGIEAGDVLLEIDGSRIGTREDVAAALGAIAAGEDVEVVVSRRGREVELEAKKRESAKKTPAREEARDDEVETEKPARERR